MKRQLGALSAFFALTSILWTADAFSESSTSGSSTTSSRNIGTKTDLSSCQNSCVSLGYDRERSLCTEALEEIETAQMEGTSPEVSAPESSGCSCTCVKVTTSSGTGRTPPTTGITSGGGITPGGGAGSDTDGGTGGPSGVEGIAADAIPGPGPAIGAGGTDSGSGSDSGSGVVGPGVGAGITRGLGSFTLPTGAASSPSSSETNSASTVSGGSRTGGLTVLQPPGGKPVMIKAR